MDPFYISTTIGAIDLPYEILREGSDYLYIKATQEFYFTVNGKKLLNKEGKPFKIDFYGNVKRSRIRQGDGPQVLHPDLECDGFSVGGGAGLSYIDIKNQDAVALFKDRLAQSRHFVSPIYLSGTAGNEVLSIGFSDGRDVPGYTKSLSNMVTYKTKAQALMKLEGSQLKLLLQTAHKDGHSWQEGVWTFDNCRQINP